MKNLLSPITPEMISLAARCGNAHRNGEHYTDEELDAAIKTLDMMIEYFHLRGKSFDLITRELVQEHSSLFNVQFHRNSNKK
jgi:hypothetical protein